jgi:hypothetical protein
MVTVHILKQIKLFNFTKHQGVSLNGYKQDLSVKSLIKPKMRINIFIQFVGSHSSKIHIKQNTHPLVPKFGTQQHIPKLSSHTKI